MSLSKFLLCLLIEFFDLPPKKKGKPNLLFIIHWVNKSTKAQLNESHLSVMLWIPKNYGQSSIKMIIWPLNKHRIMRLSATFLFSHEPQWRWINSKIWFASILTQKLNQFNHRRKKNFSGIHFIHIFCIFCVLFIVSLRQFSFMFVFKLFGIVKSNGNWGRVREWEWEKRPIL